MIGKGNRVDNFQTPKWLFKILNDRFNFTVDIARDEKNDLVGRPMFDGLLNSWIGERVFCNPPFSQKEKWIKKAYDEVRLENCPVCVMLLPTNSMSASFWEKYIYGKFHFEVISGRVCFIDPETGKEKKGPDNGTTIVYFMKRITNKGFL